MEASLILKEMDLIEYSRLKAGLKESGKITLRVASDSMLPLLKIGQSVNVINQDPQKAQKFDILVFWQDNKLICHFLWAVQEKSGINERVYITKSLKSPKDVDLPIKENLILGKIDVKIPLILKCKVFMMNRWI